MMTAMMTAGAADIRRRPDEALIDGIRERYPVEREIDKILTRKMHRRGGLSFQLPSLDRLVTATSALISARIGYPVTLERARWLSGGASKLQVAFDLRWRGLEGAADAHRLTPLVMRLETAASVTETSRRREF